MARRLLVKQGKLAQEGIEWQEQDDGRIALLGIARIGDEYQVLDLAAGPSLKTVKVARADDLGELGDRINHVADGKFVTQNDPAAGNDQALEIGRYLVVPAVVWEPPQALDYTRSLSTRLRRKETFVKGELRKVEFHPDATVEPDGSITYANGPVVREDYEYVRDPIGFALSRMLTITWLRKDGSDHPVKKTRPKVYNFSQRMREGKRRRGNIVDELEVIVAGLLLETELANNGDDVQATVEHGRNFTSTYAADIADYVAVGLQTLLTSVSTDDQYPWLDNMPASLGGTLTIRAVVLATLDIWS